MTLFFFFWIPITCFHKHKFRLSYRSYKEYTAIEISLSAFLLPQILDSIVFRTLAAKYLVPHFLHTPTGTFLIRTYLSPTFRGKSTIFSTIEPLQYSHRSSSQNPKLIPPFILSLVYLHKQLSHVLFQFLLYDIQYQ